MMVKPVNPAAVIRDPITRRPLPAAGGEVPESNFWVRRLLAGEVVHIDPPTVEVQVAHVDHPTVEVQVAHVDPPTVAALVAPLTTR